MIKALSKSILKLGFKFGIFSIGKILKILGFLGKVIFIIFLIMLALEIDINRENLKDLEG